MAEQPSGRGLMRSYAQFNGSTPHAVTMAAILAPLAVPLNASDAISAAHIVSLEAYKTKLVCPSLISALAGVRYLVRRLRHILPEGTIVLVGFWADDGGGSALKALEATAEAHAYTTSLKEAARLCTDAAHSREPPNSETSRPKAGEEREGSRTRVA